MPALTPEQKDLQAAIGRYIASPSVGNRVTVDAMTSPRAILALLAQLEAAQEAPEDAPELALNTMHKLCHQAADAFWTYWNENGETHKRGYYESTWGAINRAIRMVGVVPHKYNSPAPDIGVPAQTGTAPTDADKLRAIRREYDEYMADVFAQMCGMPFAKWVACNSLVPKYIPPPKLEWEDDATGIVKRAECAICGGTRTAFGKVCDCRGAGGRDAAAISQPIQAVPDPVLELITKHADRYLWLREEFATSTIPRVWQSNDRAEPVKCLLGDELDAAIDAAIDHVAKPGDPAQ